MGLFELAATNLGSPVILCFVLGLAAALARSDLSVPEAAAKAMSIYLLFAIGFKGGVSVAAHGADTALFASIGAGLLLSFFLPVLAFALLAVLTPLSRIDRGAVAAHYGSISIVTFVAATSVLEGQGLKPEGFMVAVAAAMEAPAILSALWLIARGGKNDAQKMDGGLWREILLNGSIVLLLGAFAIGAITGERGMAEVSAFVVAPFKGVLCLFLLDMGIVAGRGLRGARKHLTGGTIAFAVLMPVISSLIALPLGVLIGLSTGGIAILMVLSASASYIAVPAAMRVALPEANPSIYLTLSLGVTFPFNLTVGIPAYIAVASMVSGG